MSNLSMINARLAELTAQRQAIEAEEQELRIAQKVLTRLERRHPQATPTKPIPQANPDFVRLSTEEVIRHVLAKNALAWMTSNEVQAAVSGLKNRDVPMSTISPTLSGMKKAGSIVRDGNKVALTERAYVNGADPIRELSPRGESPLQ